MSDVTPIALQEGTRFTLREADGRITLWQVVKRKPSGWRVQRGDEDPVTWTHLEFTSLRSARRLEILSGNPETDNEHITYVLSRTFESFKAEHKLEALRRVEYCREVQARAEAGTLLEDCFAVVPEEVFTQHHARWQRELVELAAERAAIAQRRRRKPVDQGEGGKARALRPPRPRTLEEWHRLWTTFDEDIRVLIPAYRQRGQHGQRHPEWMYDKMREMLDEHYFTRLQLPLTVAYGEFEKFCKAKGLDAAKAKKEGKPRPYPTYQAMLDFKNSIADDREEFKRRNNSRLAYLNFHVFKKVERPKKVTEEIEIDHCLADIIVVDEMSGRPIGRPWFTAALDRASKMILGCHLSFEVPSYASLQRCLGHAFWPKDLSQFDYLENGWPCEGIADFAFVDNGKEFWSKSLKRSEHALNFRVKPLPVMSPWLKGSVERLFRRTHVQLFGLREGKTFSNALARGDYKSVRRAEVTLQQLRRDLLSYIVDDYHVEVHRSLQAAPLERWNELVSQQDGVRPVHNYDQIVELMGQVVSRPISNTGVSLEGLTYYSPELTRLRERRGGRQKVFEVRFDPFDMGEVYVLDVDTGAHIRAECTNQQISRGVSLFAAKLHLKHARRLGKGKYVSEANLATVKQQAEAESDALLADGRALTTAKEAARYRAFNGEYFTPLVGVPTTAERHAKQEYSRPQVWQVPVELPQNAPASPSTSLDEEAMALMKEWSSQ